MRRNDAGLMNDTDIHEQLSHPDFRPEAFIAAGGMGAVIAAEEVQTGRSVAVKVMHPQALASEEAVNRFYIEAQVLAQLEHPNIVPLHSLRTDAAGRPFYSMKKVQGRTLQQIIAGLRKGDAELVAAYPLSRLLTVFLRVCDAIGFAHARRIVHRDLKPANIMVGEFGEVLVMDWGLAKLLGRPEAVPEAGLEFEEDAEGELTESGLMSFGSGLTLAGAVMGTPQYMAPEQAEGRVQDIDARSDVFALGAILYSILTLHPPVSGRNLKDLLSRVATGDFAPPMAFNSHRRVNAAEAVVRPEFRLLHCPGHKVPEALSEIVMKAMAVNPEARYQTVEQFQADLEAWRRGYATSAQRPSLFRQLSLLIARNRAAFIVALILHLVAAGFLFRVAGQRRAAEAALVDLRRALPMLEEEARARIAGHQFDPALKRLDQCVKMMPGRASLHRLRGDVLQTLTRFDEAAAAYATALRLDPRNGAVSESLKFTERLRAGYTGNAVAVDRELKPWLEFLTAQGRHAEAGFLRHRQQELHQELQRRVAAARQFLGGRGLGRELVSRVNWMTHQQFKGVSLEVNGISPPDFTKLKGAPLDFVKIVNVPGFDSVAALNGLPLKGLFLIGTGVRDLTPLAGLALQFLEINDSPVASLKGPDYSGLRSLTIRGTPITDLSPVQNAPLEHLDISHCRELRTLEPVRSARLMQLAATGSGITNLAPLAGMPLQILDLTGLGTLDLAPLKGAPLENLNLGECPISDIRPLAGMPLKKLFISGTQVGDLSPLRGMALDTLGVERGNISDLSPLAGMPLRWLRVNNTRVSDLTPLAGMPLADLALDLTLIRALDPLRNAPLQNLSLNRTAVASVEPLAGSPLRRIEIAGCVALTDLSPLGSCMQLETLILPHPPAGVPHQFNLDELRALPFLRTLGYGTREGNPTAGSTLTDAVTFWGAYDPWRRAVRFR